MKKILVAFLILVIPFAVMAQNTDNKKAGKPANSKADLPYWAPAHKYDARAHVYFPDYYTFYDAKQKGYYYWDNGQYKFTPALPPFLEKVDMSKTRIQILKGLSLDLHPEQNYPYYMKLYPAEHENNMVPVPR